MIAVPMPAPPEIELKGINEMSDVVRAERIDGSILLLEIDRPEARNAINAAVRTAMDIAVRESEADDSVRVVILTGAGDHAFCARADLKTIAADNPQELGTPLGGFAGVVNFPRTKPWIAAVNGHALAGGCELMVACDIAIACEQATFGLPEVRRGLVAAAGGAYRIARTLPRSLAMELTRRRRAITASAAL